jgi:hypothetical protein
MRKSRNVYSRFEVRESTAGRPGWAKAALLAASLLAIATGPAGADPLRIEYTGVVVSVDAELLGGPVLVGDPVVGSLTVDYDFAVDDWPSDPTRAKYLLDDSGDFLFDLTLGAYSLTATPYVPVSTHRNLVVYDDWTNSVTAPLYDQWGLFSSVVGDLINGYSPAIGHFGLFSSPEILTSLLPSADEINGFDVSDGGDGVNWLQFSCCSGSLSVIRWELTSFVAVPEVSAPALVPLGLIALGVLRRRSIRRS